MNLYLRLVWLLITYRFKKPLQFTDKLSVSKRVQLNDLDFNGHINNGRYLTLVDLVIIELFLRSGVMMRAIRRGWRPMVGGVISNYRQGLKPFESYTLQFQLESWDERWNYFKFEFLRGKKVVVSGYVKGAMASKRGWVKTSEGDLKLGVARGRDKQLSAAVKHWNASELAMTELL